MITEALTLLGQGKCMVTLRSSAVWDVSDITAEIWHVSMGFRNETSKGSAYRNEKMYCVNKRKLIQEVITPDPVDNFD
ncbi:hypothetical protein Tco_0973969 [Tanacetum coccineum]|uniref:Uncharacterized protein n=1 Tax=Tanacetum coccineum TaxID=301880 RepID=A0ABQ5EAA2_9ASTR